MVPVERNMAIHHLQLIYCIVDVAHAKNLGGIPGYDATSEDESEGQKVPFCWGVDSMLTVTTTWARQTEAWGNGCFQK